MLLLILLSFSILDEFNLQKLLNFLLHPSLSRINAEFSPLRLKAVKENKNIENTEIEYQILLMSNHDMFSLERNCDSYMTAFTHGRLSFWNLKPMMGSGTTAVETLVQHGGYTFSGAPAAATVRQKS